ncbi:MAG: glycoside hydrolase family protein, partial [Planctomycetota bacterium]
GTAGVALFLVALHEALVARDGADVDGRFLEAALAGARHLRAVADTTDGGCRIMHHEPDGEALFYLGWCHGPVGTAQLFARLERVTGDAVHGAWEARCARAVRVSGIPRQRTPGFWNNVGRCCGSAGVASFFLARHRRLGDDSDLAFAKTMIDDLLARATEVALADGRVGLKWVQAEHRARPELLVAQTGYTQGAAGIGLTLLELDALQRGRHAPRAVPDLAP